MNRPRGVWNRLLVVMAIMVLAVLQSVSMSPVTARAHDEPFSKWEQLGVSGPVYRLFTPPSGMLVALTADGLYRSSDSGTTWKEVPIPHPAPAAPLFFVHWALNPVIGGRSWFPLERGRVAVHPTDPDTIYAPTTDGLGKTTDGGATWSTVIPSSCPNSTRPTTVLAVGVSPVNPEIVYAITGLGGCSTYVAQRSDDGGATWTEIDRASGALGYWYQLLYPHPTDASQALGVQVPEGRSQSKRYVASMTFDPWTGRLYEVVRAAGRPSIERVEISSDGRRWTTIFSLPSFDGGISLRSETRITAVAPHPWDATQMYVAINQFQRSGRDSDPPLGPISGRVAIVRDTGAAADLIVPDLGWIYDLTLSRGGSYLYAATEHGLWRLSDPALQPRG